MKLTKKRIAKTYDDNPNERGIKSLTNFAEEFPNTIKYIERWQEIKQNSKGPRRQMAKLKLNNLYGKLAQPSNRKPAYVREYIIRAAQKNYNRFCYADTDSPHLIGNALPLVWLLMMGL